MTLLQFYVIINNINRKNLLRQKCCGMGFTENAGEGYKADFCRSVLRRQEISFLQDLRFSVEEMRGVFIESSRQGRIFSVSFEETQ